MTDTPSRLHWKYEEAPDDEDDELVLGAQLPKINRTYSPNDLGPAWINRADGTSEKVNDGGWITRADAERLAAEGGYELAIED